MVIYAAPIPMRPRFGNSAGHTSLRGQVWVALLHSRPLVGTSVSGRLGGPGPPGSDGATRLGAVRPVATQVGDGKTRAMAAIRRQLMRGRRVC